MKAVIQALRDREPAVFDMLSDDSSYLEAVQAYIDDDPSSAHENARDLGIMLFLLNRAPELIINLARNPRDVDGDKEQAAGLLHEAARLLSNIDPAKARAIEEILSSESSDSMGNALAWLENGIEPDNRSARGGASSSTGGLNGFAVREIQRRMATNQKSNYALISRLAALAGLTISRQNVRGILLNGRT